MVHKNDDQKGGHMCKAYPLLRPPLSQVKAELRGEWPNGLYSLCQVTEVKLGRVRSDFGWVTSEA